MVGSGAIVFAVMGYVIANYRLDRKVGAQVTLNPSLLAAILGEDEPDVVRAIEFLSSPDTRSTSKEDEGRRLVKIGEFDYRVVNGAKYATLRNEEERREYNRIKQQEHRARITPAKPRKKKSSSFVPDQSHDDLAHKRNLENGLVDRDNRIVHESNQPQLGDKTPGKADMI